VCERELHSRGDRVEPADVPEGERAGNDSNGEGANARASNLSIPLLRSTGMCPSGRFPHTTSRRLFAAGTSSFGCVSNVEGT
jgi:hypothetical protein